MSRLILKGGYGEHGRNCFLVEYGSEGRMFMVDCGIMDTDPFPYPKLTEEELEQIDYLFLTHCHRDHSGAFAWICEHGFHGMLIASSMTLRLSGISYGNMKVLTWEKSALEEETDLGPLAFRYGRSGHCPGGLWFCIRRSLEYYFFSGDYQEHALFYACDPVKYCFANIAVIDCAHKESEEDASELRRILVEKTAEKLRQGSRVIFPVPKYGRGLELFLLMKQNFPDAAIRVDCGFAAYADEMLSEPEWYQEAMLAVWQEATWNVMNLKAESESSEFDYDILMIADTHLKEKEHEKFVKRAVKEGAFVMVTGRIKKGSAVEKLLSECSAERYLYPHHQSAYDLRTMMACNSFAVVFPFHNQEKEVLF